MEGQPRDRAIPFLLLSIWVGVALGMVYTRGITIPTVDNREDLIGDVLEGRAPPGYVYAMYAIARAHEDLVHGLGWEPKTAYVVVDFAGLVYCFLCAGLMLVALFPRTRSRIAGLMWLGCSSPLLFANHIYHPSDFYGTGLMCLILLAARKHRPLLVGVLCLMAGLLWEKTVLVPIVYLVATWREAGARTAILRVIPAGLGAGAAFIGWRLAFDMQFQPHVMPFDHFIGSLPDAVLPWCVWGLPILIVLADVRIRSRPVDPFWLRWLLCWPLLVLVIVVFRGYLAELRSFWILQPIFAGLIAGWVESRTAPA